MDRRDQELLDKQLHAIYRPPRPPGLVAMAAVAIFLAGLVAGSVLTHATMPAATPRIAANGTAMAFLDNGTPITRN